MKTVYGLKKLISLDQATQEKAKVQILGAMALIARSTAFPPLTFTVANVASAMVAEAIALIVLTLYKETNNIDELLQKSEYLKGMVINVLIIQYFK